MNTLERRIIELESRYAHQEKMLHELSDVLFAQERTIEQLKRDVLSLRDRGPDQFEGRDEPPPHY